MTTAVALDLGGGSTQITYRPLEQQSINTAPDGYIKQMKVFGKSVQLYSNRYVVHLNNMIVLLQLSRQWTHCIEIVDSATEC